MTTLSTLNKFKKDGTKFTCLTCYDAMFARMMEKAQIDTILIGDSLGMVVQGHDSTLPVTVADMVYHTANIARSDKVNADANSSSKDQRDDVKSDKGDQHKAKGSEPRSPSQSAAAKSSSGRTVAQSPKLVTMDNEPIPYKRRRRQPSSELQVADVKSSATANYSAKEPEAADKSEVKVATSKKVTISNKDTNEKVTNKKVESAKSAEAIKTDKSNQVAKVQVDIEKVAKGNVSEKGNSEQSTNKGPVPSKRRRRQPSTDIAASKA